MKKPGGCPAFLVGGRGGSWLLVWGGAWYLEGCFTLCGPMKLAEYRV